MQSRSTATTTKASPAQGGGAAPVATIQTNESGDDEPPPPLLPSVSSPNHRQSTVAAADIRNNNPTSVTDEDGTSSLASSRRSVSIAAAQPQQNAARTDYYSNSYWQPQSHPTYCSWRRTPSPSQGFITTASQQTPSQSYSTTVTGGTGPATTVASYPLPHSYESSVRRLSNTVLPPAPPPHQAVYNISADVQSICSNSVDASTISYGTSAPGGTTTAAYSSSTLRHSAVIEGGGGDPTTAVGGGASITNNARASRHLSTSSLILTPTPHYHTSVDRPFADKGGNSTTPRDFTSLAARNAFLMSISPPPSGIGAGGPPPAAGQLSASAAVTASMTSSQIPQLCCECPTTQNRCSTDYCPCYASRRMCDEHCESARYRGDCLNQAICKCSCEVDPSKPAKNACAKSERCDCVRIKEACSKLCACRQICKNKEPPAATRRQVAKIAKPSGGCQCAKTKKQCAKKECQCRGVYEFCSSSCKCAGDCLNGASKFHVPKHVQNCFLEHKQEASGLIVTLIGDDYIYRGDFYHESKSDLHVEEQLVAAIYDLISKYKVDLYEIVIFVSKSPCFHQDCDPKCEVVDECRSNKACAKLLGLLLSKVRKELSKVDVRMTAKFLYPHLNRGDLYTKQGILSMLQAGIKVEPLLLKDWSAIMDWSPHGTDSHKGEYLQMWGNHNLDKSVAQSQSFINECRRALGLSMKFWVAEIHEIVTNTILNYSDIRQKCNELNEALKQLDLTATPHKIRSTPSKRRSFIDILELRDKLLMRGNASSTGAGGGESRNKNGSSISVASEDAHAQAMVASFCGRSFDDNETNEIAQRIRRATININLEIEQLLEFLTHKSASS